MKEMTIDDAMDHINKEIGRIKKVAQAGLWEAGLKIMQQAQRRLKASVITGNLRASGYVRAEQDLARPMPDSLDATKNEPIPADKLTEIGVELGFTANYGLFVHENMEGRAPKFLEGVIMENQQAIIDIVKKRSGGE